MPLDLPFKVQLTPKIIFRLYKSPCLPDHHCEKIIVLAIFVNFLCHAERRMRLLSTETQTKSGYSNTLLINNLRVLYLH